LSTGFGAIAPVPKTLQLSDDLKVTGIVLQYDQAYFDIDPNVQLVSNRVSNGEGRLFPLAQRTEPTSGWIDLIMKADGTEKWQLTDSHWEDAMPCFVPKAHAK
jgi:hypothetical protein